MGLLKNTMTGKQQKDKALEAMLDKKDIEFLLLNMKNSMISGSMLEQAVITAQKLQNIHRKLSQLEKKA